MGCSSGALREAGTGQRHGTSGAGTGNAGRLDRRSVRDSPATPVSTRAAVFHGGRADVAGFPGIAPFAACRRAPDGPPARIAGGAVRQGQAYRAALAAGLGPGQRPAPGAGRLGLGHSALPARLAGAHHRRQSSAGLGETPGAAAQPAHRRSAGAFAGGLRPRPGPGDRSGGLRGRL